MCKFLQIKAKSLHKALLLLYKFEASNIILDRRGVSHEI
jgi:hypothetical protein